MSDLDIPKARGECQTAMAEIPDIDDGELRGRLELRLQHIYAALGGEKEDLYKDD